MEEGKTMEPESNPHGRVMKLRRGLKRGAGPGGAGVEGRSLCARLRAWLGRNAEGQSIVEFAFVLPLLVLTVFGICSIAMGTIAYQQLGSAVSNAAENGLAVERSALTSGDPCAAAASSITAKLPSWNKSNFTYTVVIYNGPITAPVANSSGALAGPSPSCTGLYADMTELDPATLTVTYQYNWYYLGKLFGAGKLTQSRTVNVY